MLPFRFDLSHYRAQTAVATLVGQAFAVYYLILITIRPPDWRQWSQADPILKIFPQAMTLWGIAILAVGITAWWARAHPAREQINLGLRHAALGILAAVVCVLTFRALVGPNLPFFIPPEEGAKPGYGLSMAAGLSEELLFRLLLLPALLLSIPRRRSADRPILWIASAIVVQGLAFALLHEAGNAGPWNARYFATRMVFPGIAMGTAAIVVGPCFTVVAHCTAHLLIPALFH